MQRSFRTLRRPSWNQTVPSQKQAHVTATIAILDSQATGTRFAALISNKEAPTAQPPTPEEIKILAQRAGLNLPPEYFTQLVSAYGNVRRIIDQLPANRPRGDEPAHVFVAAHFRPEGK